MRKFVNVALALLFIATKQGTSAQIVKTENDPQTNTEKVQVDPATLGQAITVNPYDYSSKKKADGLMKDYLVQIETEKKAKEAAKEEERKANEAKKLLVKGSKIDKRSDFNDLYEKAGKAFSIHPKLLHAVHIVETGGRGSTSINSYAGARGPMQFMPATFRAYGVDGNSDGVKDIDNVDDAIFSAAKYLAANKGATNIRQALWHYNHSNAYVEKVIGIAQSLGMN